MSVVDIDNLRKEYGTLVAVRDVSMTIEQGDVVGLIGPNGAGKTTLLRLLATLLTPTSGRATVLGLDTRSDYLAVRRRVGFMPDFFNLYDDLTLEECVGFFGRAYGVSAGDLPARVREALSFVELAEKRSELIGHLSRGMTQRLGLATLLVHNPELLLLDEPASGLDPHARIRLRQVLQKIAAAGRTVIISSHILTELEDLCSHVCIMDAGAITVRGSVESIRQQMQSPGTLEIRVLSDLAGAANLSRSIPGVTEVVVEGERLVVRLDTRVTNAARVNRALVEANIDVVGLAAQSEGLEDLFMRITGQQEGATHAGV